MTNPDDLPSYAQLAQQEGPNSRFGRWTGWVEKRAQERREERAQNPTRPRGWTLDGDASTTTASSNRLYGPERLDVSSLTSAGVRHQANALRVTNLESPPLPKPASQALCRSPSTAPLTASGLSIHKVLDRFEPQLPEKPLCSAVLRVNGLPQYVLIGTKNGLYCVDLAPNGQRTGQTLESAKCFPVWSSPAIFNLEVIQQEFGILLVLIATTDDSTRAVRLFPLQALFNLCRYRSSPQAVELKLPPFTEGEPGKKREKRTSTFLKRALSRQGPGSPSEAPRSSEEDGDYVVVNGPAEKPVTAEWLSSSVPLKLPASHAPILSMHLLEPPSNDLTTLYVALISRTTIYLFETPPDKRSFSLYKEFYTPQTARAVSLVLVTRSKGKGKATSEADGELALFVGMADKGVLIKLSDSSVIELELPPTISPSSTSSKILSGRARSRSRVNSLLSSHEIPKSSRASRFTRRNSFSNHSRSASDSVDSLKEALGLNNGRFWSCSHLSNELGSFYFLTRERTTYAIKAPFIDCSTDPRASLSSRHDPRRSVQVEPVFEWQWKSRDVAAVTVSLKTQTQSHVLVLTAVTPSGFEVQEGLASLDSNSPRPFFLPVAISSDLDSSASYDFGSAVGALCSFNPFVDAVLHRQASVLSISSRAEEPESKEREQEKGCLLWVTGLNEYKLRFVG